jgi:hypothetical protein
MPTIAVVPKKPTAVHAETNKPIVQAKTGPNFDSGPRSILPMIFVTAANSDSSTRMRGSVDHPGGYSELDSSITT